MAARSTELPATTAAPRMARHLVAAMLGERGCSVEVVDSAELLVSELVTNAIRHAASNVVVRVELDGGGLLVEVQDDDPSPPRLRGPEPDALDGRGIALVDALASRWGVNTLPDDHGRAMGKVVWFRISC
jgi:anti-sigma regulatory factor (Ser/Thr protein kinase)